MRNAALAVYALGLIAFGVFVAYPYLTAQHDTPAEVASPPPLAVTALDVLKGGQQLCTDEVAMSRQSEQVRFRVGNYGKPGPPLLVTVRAPGYASSGRIRAGWADNVVQVVPLRRPARDQHATLCIRNAGRRQVAVYAATGNAPARASAGAPPEISFYERRPQSIADNADLTPARIATFRGIFSETWIVWTLAVLFALGVPVLMGAALWAGLKDS